MLSRLKYHIAIAIYKIVKKIEHIAMQGGNNFLLPQFASVGSHCIFQYNDYNIVGSQFIKIGNGFSVGRNLRMEVFDKKVSENSIPQLMIGENVRIEDYCHIGCVNKVIIGDGVLIASKVFITDHYHGNITSEDLDQPPSSRPLSSNPVIIGNNVWIGDTVSIMPGVVLGDNVIVGANSVVTHSFPPNVVIAGCPAKVIKILKK